MVTISEITEKIIIDSPFLAESIGEGLINVSALARKLRPRIEKELMKDIKEGAIIMALKRLQPKFDKSRFSLANSLIRQFEDITVKSNLTEYSFKNSDTLISKIKILIEQIENQRNKFLTLSQGVFETAIIINSKNQDLLEHTFKEEFRLTKTRAISSITIKLAPKNVQTTGVYYLILKAIAWNNINMIDALSTPEEITIFFDEKNVEKAFTVINNLAKSK